MNEEGKGKERDVKEKEMKSNNKRNKNEEAGKKDKGVCMCVYILTTAIIGTWDYV